MSCGVPSHAPEYRRKYRAAYRSANLDKVRSVETRWREENPEKVRAYRARYDEGHRDNTRMRVASWSKEHPKARNALSADYSHRKRANGGTFPRAAWEHLKALFGHCCAYCGRRMTKLTQDHVIPISKGGWHFSGNIVPACRPCNSKKGVSL